MKVLIIGGSGILSSAVVDRCIACGFDVTIMNRGNNATYTNPYAKLIICNARNAEQVKEKTIGLQFDTVIDFIVYEEEQLKLSIELFSNLADQYIFISSAQVYNTSLHKILEESDDTPQPLWQYSVNKNICEKYLREVSADKGFKYTIVRPGVNYDNRRIPYGMYPPIGMHWTMVERIKAGKPIITWNNGENKLNITRVEDFARGLVGLIGNNKAYNETFNVVGDFVYQWKDVLTILGKILGIHVNTINLELKQYASELMGDDKEMLLGGRACDLHCSNKKLKAVMPDYKSSIELEEGIKMTLDWYTENDYYFGFDYHWDADQDRIIHKYVKQYKGYFVPFVKKSMIATFLDKCEWKIAYNKDSIILKYFWKALKKFIVEPLNNIYTK